MSITYRQLKAVLDKMNSHQLDETVSIGARNSSECFPGESVEKVSDEHFLAGILDNGHSVIIINA